MTESADRARFDHVTASICRRLARCKGRASTKYLSGDAWHGGTSLIRSVAYYNEEDAYLYLALEIDTSMKYTTVRRYGIV